MSDDLDKKLIMDLLKKNLKQSEETQDCVDDLSSDLKLHVQKTVYELKEITRTNEAQNEILTEHQQRSIALQKDVELREKQIRSDVFGKDGLEPRVTKLEEPKKLLKLLVKIILGAGAIASAIWYLARML